MQEQSDAQLLRDYAGHGREAAFREIVARHTDFVYSAALRQVNSPDLAGDLAQGVFCDLARKSRLLAETMTADSSLAGWLHRSTRYAALNLMRDTRRRVHNERQAMEQLLANSEAPVDWNQIRPALDEALDRLGAADREAILLRYFKNQELRAVGRALGVSDDAAQKRVSRAVEKLREYFSKRKITVGAGGLVALVSANAVQSAPAGLAAMISGAAVLTGTAVSTSTAIAATKTIAMTTLQKTLVTVVLAAAVGTGFFETHQAAQLRKKNQALQQEQASMAGQIQQLQHERDNATSRLAALLAENEQSNSSSNQLEILKLRGKVAALKNAATDPTAAAAQAWLDRVNQLKQRLEATPQARIPEFQFLDDEDWLAAVKDRNLDTDEGYRRAVSTLRTAAENKFATQVESALQKYSQANNKQFPTDLFQLQPYFDTSVDAAILQRWQIVSGKSIPSLRGFGDWIVTEKAPVDDLFDSRIAVGLSGYGNTDWLSSEYQTTLQSVYKAFSKANNGQNPTDISQLLPYASTPAQQTAVQKWMQRDQLNK